MQKETPIINILTYQLPYELASQIYNEFQNRYREANQLIEKYKTYKSLQDNLKAVELFLSLSIFHRRVIANLEAAVKFHGTVTNKSEASAISIGSYDLTEEEKNKLLAVVISYNKLLQKFSIHPTVMEYYETRDLLKGIINLKSELDNGENPKKQNRRRGGQEEDDFPF